LPPRRKDKRSPLATSHEGQSKPPDSGESGKAGGTVTPYYPVMLHVQGKRCMVVGGGEVALRRVKALMEHDAHVEIISPELCPELSQLAATGAVKATLRE